MRTFFFPEHKLGGKQGAYEPARRCYEAEGFVRIDRGGFKARRESHADGEWEYFYMEAKAGQLEQ